MNQELMTLDFWQDTIIYEDKALPIGTLACDALNVSADTLAKMNEQCQKINLLLGMLNAGQDASALFPMAKEAALTMLEILSKTPPFSYMDIPKHRERIEKVLLRTAHKNMWSLLQKLQPILYRLKKFRNMLMRRCSNVIPLYSDIWHILLGNTKPQCLILRKNQTATKQTVPQRALQKCSAAISRRSFPSRRAMPGCLLRTTLFSM
mgnify:FL=1